jgi:hypothetical protein
MAYDDGLAHRIRSVFDGRAGVAEKEMFGSLVFMLDDDMCCGVIEDSLMARVGPEAYDDALSEPHVRPMDFTGQPMRGFVYVDQPAIATNEDLEEWVDRCVAYAESLAEK